MLHNIENIPFAELATKYDSLLTIAWRDFKSFSTSHRDRAELAFVKDWNKCHEESFEGDFEEETGYVPPKFAGLTQDQRDEFKEYLTEFSTKWKVKANSEWIFGQMLAKFSTLSLTKSDTGYDGNALLEEIRKSPFLSGMLVMCRFPTRGNWIKDQTDPKYRDYCSLVPLIMSAFKKYKKINYSEWDRSTISSITEKELATAMLHEELPDLTVDQILEARTDGLTYKKDTKLGEVKPVKTTYRMYISAEKGHGLESLDPMTQIMLCQTWAAHPSNRTEYMILDPLDWDHMPEPILSTVVLKNAVASSKFDPPDTILGADRVPWV